MYRIRRLPKARAVRPSTGLRLRVAIAGIALLLGGCDCSGRSKFATDIQRDLRTGRDSMQALLDAQEQSPLAGEQAIMLGYMERLRLGLGSPFRLIEYAYNDPRLGAQARSAVTWALLDATLDRRAYVVQPRSLDRFSAGWGSTAARSGDKHLDLLEEAIRNASDPRTGELAVRTAYMLAAAEGSVTPETPLLAGHAAALVRDRELARRDAIRLLRSATEAGSDPFLTLIAWRSGRQFEVEAPPSAPLPSSSDIEAAKIAPKLALKIRALSTDVDDMPQATRIPVPLLNHATALRLAAVSDSANLPPQTPIRGTMAAYRRNLEQQAIADPEQQAALHRFAHQPSNEERFAAEHAIATHALNGSSVWVPHAALRTAVAMRTYAQERVWYAGYAAPSARELKAKHRLASITFDATVPQAWRPYYRRMIGEALGDLETVFPKIDLRGLHVRIGRTGMDSGVLAFHSPQRRTIYLVPGMGAGTIAHEIAHDLDWQVGRRKYKAKGSYATDLAVRKNYQDQFAAAMRTMPAPRSSQSSAKPEWDYGSRPAEIFARSVDWYVMSTLAAKGRTNGYLSAIQDDLLKGLGSVEAPYPTGENALAFSRLLTVSSALPENAVAAFLSTHGPKRPVRGNQLVAALTTDLLRLDEPQARENAITSPDSAAVARTLHSAASEIAAIEAARTHLLSEGAGTISAEQKHLVDAAAGARVRGVLLRKAAHLGGHSGRERMLQALYGGPAYHEQLDPITESGLQNLYVLGNR